MNPSDKFPERWVEKDPWLEFRYCGEEQLAVLEGGIEILTRSSRRVLDGPASLGCSLAPYGSSFVGDAEKLWALQKPAEQGAAASLLSWSLAQNQASESVALEGPATQLQLGRLGPERWVSWIGLSSEGAYSCFIRRGGSISRLTSFGAIPYSFAWHPSRALCFALLVPHDSLPWGENALELFSYEWTAEGPSLRGGRSLSPFAEGAPSSCLEAHFTADGTAILGLWRTGEWYQLWVYELDAQRWKQLSAGNLERARPRRRADVQTLLPLPEKRVLSLVQERGFFRLEELSHSFSERAEPSPIPGLKPYSSLKQPCVSPSGERFSVVGGSSQETPTLLSFKRAPNQSWALESQVKSFAEPVLPGLSPEALSWPAADGQLVQGLLYRDPRRSGPLPLLLPIHGGPTEQVLADWPRKAQAFVQRGYAVLYVNYRGSWGYGWNYHHALAGRWGELDLDDIVSSIAPLAAAGWIDPQRVGLWGGDIGGSTVLRLLQRFPKLFKAAVAVYPICDLSDYCQRVQGLSRAELRWALGSLDKTRLEGRSPLFARHKIETPLALFHGALDPLVPVKQVEALAADVTRRGVACWLKIYPSEGHSWRARSTIDDYNCRVESFFARFLRRKN